MWIGLAFTSLIFLVFSNLYIDPAEQVFIIDQNKLGLSFIVLGIAFGIYTTKNYFMEKKMTWSCTVGRISSIDSVNTVFGQTKYILNYSYTVDDRPHSNNMFDFSNREVSISRLKFHRGIKTFSAPGEIAGEMIKVYYNAKKPWESAVARQGKVSIMVTLLPSLTLISYCLYSLLTSGV